MQAVARRCVLILDADSRAGLAAVQSLGRSGLSVHAAVRARGNIVEHSRWCGQVHLQPEPENVAYGVEWLRAVCTVHSFCLIIAATETSLRWLRKLAPDDPIRRNAVLPSNHALDTALSKEKTRVLAQSLGIPVPRSRLLSARADLHPTDCFACPSVLKPETNKVAINGRLESLAPVIVRHSSTRQTILSEWLPNIDVLEQEWVPGRGVGVEMVFDRGRLVAQFMHERLHELPLTGGASTLRRAAQPDHDLIESSRRLLEALQWHGAAMVEWRRADDGVLHLMEINPRLWGSLPLTIAAGIDVPKMLLQIAQDRTPAPVTQWKVGTTARNLSDDLRWHRANAQASHDDPLLLTEPRSRALRRWLRVFSGNEIYDGWSLRDSGVAFAELASLGRWLQTRVSRGIRRWRLRRRMIRNHAALFGPSSSLPQLAQSVVFLCSGNICRSPFAAEIARRRLPGWRISSAGLEAQTARRSPDHLVQTAREFGIDLARWVSSPTGIESLEAADLIVVMDFSHVERILRDFPQIAERTTLLGLFNPAGPIEIEDPAFEPEKARPVLDDIVGAVDAMAATLNARDRAVVAEARHPALSSLD